jgi:hypothetical protein
LRMFGAAAANVAFMRRQDIAYATDRHLARNLLDPEGFGRASRGNCNDEARLGSSTKIAASLRVSLIAPLLGSPH